jgi:hypothetical protein
MSKLYMFSGIEFDGTYAGLTSALDTLKREALGMFKAHYMLEGEPSDESPTSDIEFLDNRRVSGGTLSDYIDWCNNVPQE